VIVGLGRTGLSCARYFVREGIPFALMDREPAPAGLAELRLIDQDLKIGPMDLDGLRSAAEIVLSPGVPRASIEIQQAIAEGVRITNDVAMFSEVADAPVIVITGSNGKSTVTMLVGEMARCCGRNPGVGGNIGIPCLDLLAKGHDLYVLELSSYQLETATDVRSAVAVVLNLSPDHMDRYPDLESYYRTKAGVYRGCRVAVLNRGTGYEFETGHADQIVTFGVDEPVGDNLGLRHVGQRAYLCRGTQNLLDIDDLMIRGGHNHQNALAALAIGSALGWEMSGMLRALRQFPGLSHRSEWVAEIGGVTYINDSKSTNVGSTMATALSVWNRPASHCPRLGGPAVQGIGDARAGAVSGAGFRQARAVGTVFPRLCEPRSIQEF
jgi:UDP-N-acetylmuramoylalanine--D-glutamate ligase